MKRITAVVMLVTVLGSYGGVRADVKLPAIFGDHMVLQRGTKVPVWGTADAGERITVKAAGQAHTTTADAQGKWRVSLDPLDSQDPISLTVIGKTTVRFTD